MRILLVDDDVTLLEVLRETLEMWGHEVIACPLGEDALEYVEAGLRPDLAILDLNMPGLGGPGTLAGIKKILPQLPVLVVSGESENTIKEAVKDYPEVGVLTKPFRIGILKGYLESL